MSTNPHGGQPMRGLDAAEMTAWRAYIEGSLRLNMRIDEDLRSSQGMTLFDYHVLVLLAEAPGGQLRMRDLAARMVFAPSRLTYQVARMEGEGLIRREVCPDDRRGSYAAITPGGRDALRQATAAHAASIRRHLLSGLEPEDVEHLGRLFARLQAHLAALTEGSAPADGYPPQDHPLPPAPEAHTGARSA